MDFWAVLGNIATVIAICLFMFGIIRWIASRVYVKSHRPGPSGSPPPWNTPTHPWFTLGALMVVVGIPILIGILVGTSAGGCIILVCPTGATLTVSAAARLIAQQAILFVGLGVSLAACYVAFVAVIWVIGPKRWGWAACMAPLVVIAGGSAIVWFVLEALVAILNTPYQVGVAVMIALVIYIVSLIACFVAAIPVLIFGLVGPTI